MTTRNQIKIKNLFIAVCACVIFIQTAVGDAYGETINAGNITITPGNMVSINVNAENGGSMNDVEASLTDESGNIVAQWKNHNEDIKYGKVKYTAIGSAEHSVRELSSHISGRVLKTMIGEGTAFNPEYAIMRIGASKIIRVYCQPHSDTDYTVPAGKVALNVDTKWSGINRECTIKYNKETYTLNKLAGKCNEYSAPVGDTNTLMLYASPVNAGFGVGKPQISSTATSYTRVTVNLNEVWGGASLGFDKQGNAIYSTSTGEKLSLSKIDGDRYGILIIVSGAVVNACIPDENGNVNILVENKGLTMKRAVVVQRGGGRMGSWGATSGKAWSRVVEMNASAVYPENNVNLCNLDGGNYYLNIKSKAYGLDDTKKITVNNANGIQQINYTVRKKTAEQQTTETDSKEEETTRVQQQTTGTDSPDDTAENDTTGRNTADNSNNKETASAHRTDNENKGTEEKRTEIITEIVTNEAGEEIATEIITVVVDEDETTPQSGEDKSDDSISAVKTPEQDAGSHIWLWILLAVIAASGIAYLIIILLKKRKRDSEEV